MMVQKSAAMASNFSRYPRRVRKVRGVIVFIFLMTFTDLFAIPHFFRHYEEENKLEHLSIRLFSISNRVSREDFLLRCRIDV